ncbi:MAG: DUF2877 domain-containing protein, partial [Chloroflexi bacterium]|nr:DUF2877 domain-containing protein [Chloroflexota bacterium]
TTASVKLPNLRTLRSSKSKRGRPKYTTDLPKAPTVKKPRVSKGRYHLFQAENKSKRINSEIVIEASPLTTTLSISWLISAAKGEFDMKWHDLFEAIKKQEIHHVYLGMKEIFTHGSTSGSDAIAGFISLLYFYFNHPNYSNN